MVICLNTVLSAKKNRSPESKKGHLRIKTALIFLYNVVFSGLFVAWRGWHWTTICNSPGRETRTILTYV